MLFPKPLEAKIELVRDCNYNCGFCFNANTAGTCGAKQLSTAEAKRIISKIASEGIERVRFTGGEPLLRKDLSELLRFARQSGLYVMLNTNGSLFSPKMLSVAAKNCDNILFSLHAQNPSKEALLQGSAAGKRFFKKKISAIKSLAGRGVMVRAATILTRRNILALEEFHSLADSLPGAAWALLRPIPTPNLPKPIGSADVAVAVEKIASFNKGRKKSRHCLIENAIPFCAYAPEKVSAVAMGAVNEDGNSSLAVDSAGIIKPSYFLDIALGNALQGSFSDAWDSDFMQRLHALEFVGEECHYCRLVGKCRGGSRFSALFSGGSLYSLDPLAKPVLAGAKIPAAK
ncbi:MAG: radical SAM protein [Candidatus Diapherotrites archaeon]|nr:radical SAM protein [Candidatus Diapherotrites archaeon]